jgi:hypothetical protein
MVRVREKTPQAIVDAMERGACYSSSGPAICDIQLKRVAEEDERFIVEATVRSSEAQRIHAVCDAWGVEYHEHGKAFEEATFRLRPNARWARFEVIAPDGSKAWSNPFDLTAFDGP